MTFKKLSAAIVMCFYRMIVFFSSKVLPFYLGVQISTRSNHIIWSCLPLNVLKYPHRIIMREKRCFHFFLVVFDIIILILSGNRNMHESLDEFEFRSDLTNDNRVNCHLECLISFLTFSRLLLIRHFLNLNAMRTCIIF